MAGTDRRRFLAASARIAAGASMFAVPGVAKSRANANERIRVAVIGMRRGLAHAQSLCAMGKAGQNVEVAKLCDCDEKTAHWAAGILEKSYGQEPPVCRDMRELFDDRSIDAVSIATPDHWHAPATIRACQAHKDVFVEKPAAHTVVEGRKMVEAARKYKRMVQVGTQCRSSPNIMEGVRKLHEGIIGEIYLARAISFKVHGGLGRHKPEPVPKDLDWNLFLGPAPEQEFSQFRYRRWYWLYDFSNGDLANQPVHQLDSNRSHPGGIFLRN